VHAVIASPYMDRFLLVRPGCRNGVKIPQRNYDQLAAAAASGQEPPTWLTETVGRTSRGSQDLTVSITGRGV
jgi:hypothetical protein